MFKNLLFVFAFVLLAVPAFSQERAFAKVENVLTAEKGFYGDRDLVVHTFNQERARLGDSFETELWNFLGENVEKHYWFSMFLDTKDYLEGNKPLPELAFRVREHGVSLVGETDDEEKLGMKITLLRDMAIYSYRTGKRDSALSYKLQAQEIYNKYPDIGAFVGATFEEEYCIFENLEKNPEKCSPPETSKKTFDAGIVNGKARNLPVPVYPKALKEKGISGKVEVEVLIDETGKVVSAKAVSGAPELYESAVEAAKKATFSPTNDLIAKIKGIIVYNFVK